MGMKTLIVDDEPIARQILREELEQLDDIEIARQNTDAAKRRMLARTLPASATEAASTYLRQSAQKYYYQGQTPPQNIFNPVAWADFIQAWKRGDFRNNN